MQPWLRRSLFTVGRKALCHYDDIGPKKSGRRARRVPVGWSNPHAGNRGHHLFIPNGRASFTVQWCLWRRVKETACAASCCLCILLKILEMDVCEHFSACPSQYRADTGSQPAFAELLQRSPTFFWVSDQHTPRGVCVADQSHPMAQLMAVMWDP